VWHGPAGTGKIAAPVTRRTSLTLALLSAAFSVSLVARAETHAVAPAGGGLPALDVRVDLQAGIVVAGGAKVPIDLAKGRLPQDAQVVTETVPIGSGRSVVHVRVPASDAEGIAWEAIFAGGKAEPIFAGITGYVSGDPGERTGQALRIVPAGARSYVLVGPIQENKRICGQGATLLEPEAVYPASLDLRPATMQRLTPEQQTGAQRITAVDVGPHLEPALAKLLVATDSSVPGSRGLELTDGDPSTVWTEQRPGMGQGEFVLMQAPQEVPISRMQIVVAPPSPATTGAAPRSFYLVTGTDTFEVTLPRDAWEQPGEVFEIRFPKPIGTSCLTLVLNDAYTRNMPHPAVTIAELAAYSEFDAPGATLDDLAKKLASNRGLAATEVLKRAGPAALAAVERAYDALDTPGRAHAVDVAASHDPCDQAAPLLARAVCEPSGEAPRKAREKLERCKGAAGVLADKLRNDPPSRACIAPTLAVIAGAAALEPIADALAGSGESNAPVRDVLRSSFALALKGAPADRLAALLGDTHRSATARLEMMRAAAGQLTQATAQSDRTLDELLAGTPSFRARYLTLGPLGELAHAGDRAAAARLAGSIAKDADWPVRARAAEVSAGVPDATAALVAASHDPEPRVREAALQSLVATPLPAAVDAARDVLSSDKWSFVKAQAVAVLAKAPPSGDVDAALEAALQDSAARVRGASLVALALRRAGSAHKAIRERLDDENEDGEVRATAARALGAVCDASSVDRLTELARKLGVPGTSEDDQQIAIGALVGLAAMQPPDLRNRLAPLLKSETPPQARHAAEQAIGAHGTCH
jgi:HEAT repeat protein